MVFSSSIFLFAFLPICLGIYFATPDRFRNAVLVVLSAAFYVWGGGAFFFLMLGSAVVDYLVARAIFARVDGGASAAKLTRYLVAGSVIVNVALLFWFKYAGFSAKMFNRLVDVFGVDPVAIPTVVLPLAISFFTFQRMSFTFDVAKRRITTFPSFTNYLLFGLLFPHLIAGPIVRYVDIEHELISRVSRVDDLAIGAVRFAHGLGKKVLISDSIAPVADAAFFGTQAPGSTATAWLGALAYTFQLYFDFSGYSDMAVGLGKMFGFDFPENFNRPYSAVSITDFWRRWHMTLSGWFRDYLFIPLGGSRGSSAVTVRNLAIVFAVTGLWHGAALSFIVWGCYHGALVIVERLMGVGTTDAHCRFWPLRRALTFVLVLLGWVIFRANGLRHALEYLRRMFVPGGSGLDPAVSDAIDNRVWLAILVACGSVLLPGALAIGRSLMDSRDRWAVAARWATIGLVLPAALVIVSVGNFSPFLYFQF